MAKGRPGVLFQTLAADLHLLRIAGEEMRRLVCGLTGRARHHREYGPNGEYHPRVRPRCAEGHVHERDRDLQEGA